MQPQFSGMDTPEVSSHARSVKRKSNSVQIEFSQKGEGIMTNLEDLRALPDLLSSPTAHLEGQWKLKGKISLTFEKNKAEGSHHRPFCLALVKRMSRVLSKSRRHHKTTDQPLKLNEPFEYNGAELECAPNNAVLQSPSELASSEMHELNAFQSSEMPAAVSQSHQALTKPDCQSQDNSSPVSLIGSHSVKPPSWTNSWQASGISFSSSATPSSFSITTPERCHTELEPGAYSDQIALWRGSSTGVCLTLPESGVEKKSENKTLPSKRGHTNLSLLSIPLTITDGPLTESPTEDLNLRDGDTDTGLSVGHLEGSCLYKANDGAAPVLHSDDFLPQNDVPCSDTLSPPLEPGLIIPEEDSAAKRGRSSSRDDLLDGGIAVYESTIDLFSTSWSFDVTSLLAKIKDAYTATMTRVRGKLSDKQAAFRQVASRILPDTTAEFEEVLVALSGAFDPLMTNSTRQMIILSFFAHAAIGFMAGRLYERYSRALLQEALIWAGTIGDSVERQAFRKLLRLLWDAASQTPKSSTPLGLDEVTDCFTMNDDDFSYDGADLSRYPKLTFHVCQSIVHYICDAGILQTQGQQTDATPLQLVPPSFNLYVQYHIVRPHATPPDPQHVYVATSTMAALKSPYSFSFEDIQSFVRSEMHVDNLQLDSVKSFHDHWIQAMQLYGTAALQYLKSLLHENRSLVRCGNSMPYSIPTPPHGSALIGTEPPSRAHTEDFVSSGLMFDEDTEMVDEETPLLSTKRKLPRRSRPRSKQVPRRATVPREYLVFRCAEHAKDFTGPGGKDNHNRHMRETHGPARFFCPICRRPFRRNNNMKNHIKQKHLLSG